MAGLGTRFLPATKAQPKEMLPVVDKPLIQYAVEEAYAAGVREMIFVTGRHKRPIEDHFDMTFELEVALEQSARATFSRSCAASSPTTWNASTCARRRHSDSAMRCCARSGWSATTRSRVLLADDLMVGDTPILKQMVEQFSDWRASILAVQEVPPEQTRRYGIVAGTPVSKRLMDVTRIVEKPAPEDAPSRLGVAGRYILTPACSTRSRTSRAASAARSSSPTASRPAAAREVFAFSYEGKRYDCGSKEGFLEANVELALAHPQLGPGFRSYLKTIQL